MNILENKVRFINYVVDDTLDIRKYTKQELHTWLLEHTFTIEDNNTFGYLINMPMYQMTKDMVAQLNKAHSDKQQEYTSVFDTSIENMWLNDLQDLDKTLDAHLVKSLSIDEATIKVPTKTKKRIKK